MLKDFDQSQDLKTIAKKSLQFCVFPTYVFYVIQTETRFCYMENGWKVRMNICTALWSFMNFYCLSKSELRTNSRKVGTCLHSIARCRCCFRPYLDRFIIFFPTNNSTYKYSSEPFITKNCYTVCFDVLTEKVVPIMLYPNTASRERMVTALHGLIHKLKR